jgi:hypothetical protein
MCRLPDVVVLGREETELCAVYIDKEHCEHAREIAYNTETVRGARAVACASTR